MYITQKISKCKGVDVGLEYAIMNIQVNQQGMKLNGKHKLLVYAGDIS
jgi:hypothetical protein